MAIAKLFALNTNAIIAKYNIKTTYIHSFHNRLLGEVTLILELFMNISDLIRLLLSPTL